MTDTDLSRLRIEKTAATGGPKRRRRVPRLLVVALLIGAAAALYFAGVLTPPVSVEVATVTQVYPSQTFTLLSASGYVVAQRKAAVASKITSRLVSISVEEGSRVRQGEVLARLESEDAASVREQAAATLKAARASHEAAKADYENAVLTLRRSRELVEKGYISKSEFDAAEASYRKTRASVDAAIQNVDAAAAALRNAEVTYEYSFIRAPFDAVVLTKNADVGDIITPLGAAANAKAAVVTIADMGSLQVEADVSESNLGTVKIGQPCEIQLDALPGSRFRGEVHMIVPTADRTKASVLVKVRFIDKDERILPEMSAKVAFLERAVTPGEQEPLTALQPSAVLTLNGRKYVFLLKGERVEQVEIAAGRQLGEFLEVLSGVKAGDRVVVKPIGKMKSGVRVKMEEK